MRAMTASAITVKRFEIEGPALVEPRRIADARGHFSEVWRNDHFRAHVADVNFVQDNQSHSARRGTLRGLHFQAAPRGQGKLVRVLAGAILDVAVDARRGSPTFGHHLAVELSAGNGLQLWVPAGFLHGFCTLTDDCDVAYKVTDFYSAEHDGSVRWSDPDIGVAWPFPEAELHLSDKDRTARLLREFPEDVCFG
jgi:dTDP-4-dehydrorhamnose 3,5-epimerase